MWRQTTENVFHEFFVIENRNYDELNFFKMEEKTQTVFEILSGAGCRTRGKKSNLRSLPHASQSCEEARRRLRLHLRQVCQVPCGLGTRVANATPSVGGARVRE